jgi:hypothetical protein
MPAPQSKKAEAVSAESDASEQGDVSSGTNNDLPDPDGAASTAGVTPTSDARKALSRHKGKLAVGAAAMLGLAAFYHWREGKLARDDKDEFERLQRLKAALDDEK